MKNIVLSALLLAVVATGSASAFQAPTWGADYTCSYTNPPYPSVNGISTFVLTQPVQYDSLSRPIYRGIEYYDASYGVENRKFTFAKPVDMNNGLFTRWELTINPSGPQCKQTDVYGNGQVIYFLNCTDGHTRTCQRLY
jgi:hypothetical protein